MCPPTYSTAARETLYDQITRMITSGQMSMRRACEETGTPVATYKLWQAKHAATGGDLADARRHHSGRPAAISLTEAEQRALQFWMGLKEGRFATAIEFFMSDKECTPATRAFIKARLAEAHRRGKHPVYPVSLRRAAQLPAGFDAQYQGPKAMQHAAPVGRYSHSIRINGIEYPLTPGRVLVFDDYSTNQPYQLQYADGKMRLCRQILVGMDAGTRAYRGFYHVGKEKDQYTGADALEVILRTMEGMGHRPDVLILEKGKWHSNALRGIPLTEDEKRRWGSLEECGVIVDYQHDSRGKFELEGAFSLLQAWLAGEGADIGRFRGIMEREALDMVALNSGKLARNGRDADDCRFLTFIESVDQHERMMIELNARLKEFKALGLIVSPDQLEAEQPWQKRPLSPEHRWLFYPVKSDAIVRENGNVIKQVEGREYVFRVNGIRDDLHLPNGYRLLIAFDPERPELGCRIANRETGSANTGNHRLGACLLPAAPLLQAASRVEIWTDGQSAEDDERSGYQTRKGAIKSARTAFRAILPQGKRGLRLDTIRNRAGDRVEILSGGAAPEPETAPRETGRQTARQTIDPPSAATPCNRPEAAGRVNTAPPRQTRLKSPANTAPAPVDADALEAMEAAFLAGV